VSAESEQKIYHHPVFGAPPRWMTPPRGFAEKIEVDGGTLKLQK
jgi:hypothetical protein